VSGGVPLITPIIPYRIVDPLSYLFSHDGGQVVVSYDPDSLTACHRALKYRLLDHRVAGIYGKEDVWKVSAEVRFETGDGDDTR
jgi:hypothetical protein